MKSTPVAAAAVASFYPAFNTLFLSSGNVRSESSVTGIDELAAMIQAQGLLQSLHVSAEVDEAGKETGRYGVEAGGRRWRALGKLVEQGVLPQDTPVECKLVSAARALAVSLTENFGQQPMSPADEYCAFKNLVDSGKSVQDVATAYGLTDLYVLRRLKMARLAAPLFELFRKGEMKLEQVQALVTTDDTERQVQVWESLGQYGRNAYSIKKQLTEDEISDSDPRVKLIGVEDYKAAGGTLRQDLFAQEETIFLTDVGLVELMVGESLQVAAEAVRSEGWSFVEIIQDFDYSQRVRFNFPTQRYLPESDAVAAERVAFEQSIEALEEKADNLDWDDESIDADAENEPLQGEIEVLQAKIAGLKAAREDHSALDVTQAGALVILGQDGIEVKRGVTLRTTSVSGGVSGGGAAKPKVKADIPEKLHLNLTAHKTAAIQASLIAQPNVALAALANSLAASIFSLYDNFNNPIKVRVTECRNDLERTAPTLGVSRAAKEIDTHTADWKARLPADKKVWLAWFLEQDVSVSTDFIVYATALSTNTMAASADKLDAGAVLAEALNLDMTQWWSADAGNYFELVPKAKIIAAVTECCGEAAATPIEKMKRVEAVTHGAKLVEGLGWLPAPLRKITPVVASSSVTEAGVDSDFEEEEETAE